jgi:hypothetical protein
VADQQPHYRLTLRPLPSAYPPVIRLRRALKWLLRSFGLECVDVREVSPPAKGDRHERSAAVRR